MTNEQISEALGFTIDNVKPHQSLLVKGNLFLLNQKNDVIVILFKDPSLEYDKYPQAEHFRVMCRPKTIEDLKTIVNSI